MLWTPPNRYTNQDTEELTTVDRSINIRFAILLHSHTYNNDIHHKDTQNDHYM